jgi:NAD+ kinase
MYLAIFGKQLENSDIVYVQELINQIEEKEDTIFIYDKFFNAIKDCIKINKQVRLFSSRDEIKDKIDILLSLGGDGTLLDTRPLVINTNIAVLGINLGHLGFLTAISKNDIKHLISEIDNRNYYIEKRPLLQASYINEDNILGYAINEISFRSKGLQEMVDLDVYVNNKYLTTYASDGLIIATPTGSTAYSLSCNGPIITPYSKCLCLTPIAPHTLTLRPIIISEDDVVKIHFNQKVDKTAMLIDSYSYDIAYSKDILVQLSPYQLNLIRMSNQDFFCAIRNKLMWGTGTKKEK